MVKYHYKSCSRDTTEEVESESDDSNNKQIIKQLPALIDDKISEESFKTTIPYNFKKWFIKILNNILINLLVVSFFKSNIKHIIFWFTT